MTLSYTAPIDEMRFVLNDIFDAPTFWQNTPALSHVDSDTVDMILDEMAKFATSTLLPLNQLGDEEGAIYLGTDKSPRHRALRTHLEPMLMPAG